MEMTSEDQKNGYERDATKRKKGGLITMPFIIGTCNF